MLCRQSHTSLLYSFFTHWLAWPLHLHLDGRKNGTGQVRKATAQWQGKLTVCVHILSLLCKKQSRQVKTCRKAVQTHSSDDVCWAYHRAFVVRLRVRCLCPACPLSYNCLYYLGWSVPFKCLHALKKWPGNIQVFQRTDILLEVWQTQTIWHYSVAHKPKFGHKTSFVLNFNLCCTTDTL